MRRDTTGPSTYWLEDVDLPKQRVLALADAVIAIAMTLLVLDIELEGGLSGRALSDALDDVWTQMGTFLLSAVVIASFWRVHHASLKGVERIGAPLFWLNVFFLVLISLVPFPTRVLQDYGDQFLGPALYGAVIGAASMLLYLMELLSTPRRDRGSWRTVPLPTVAVVFLASVGIAALSPVAAMYSWIAAVPLSALGQWYAVRARRAASPPA
ncbi:TMEM175 family protein [Streptomyces fradiae]|uniref:TMEM175 family protein n=1 Tax=Streptomyces fradiae TaxID=1906 RepID=UPI0029423D02|nr:TMEM175 family protein [Streptomyces fradiae]WOI60812.1 TMEM175 family protein [Streptomyces fradiae]